MSHRLDDVCSLVRNPCVMDITGFNRSSVDELQSCNQARVASVTCRASRCRRRRKRCFWAKVLVSRSCALSHIMIRIRDPSHDGSGVVAEGSGKSAAQRVG